jgi:Ca2+-dependent lipid-binding protein
MNLTFLIPLTTCLVCGYVFKNCADEMAYLTGVVTLVSLVLSIIIAPWQIQLLVLFLVMSSTKKLLQINHHRMHGNYHEGKFY